MLKNYFVLAYNFWYLFLYFVFYKFVLVYHRYRLYMFSHLCWLMAIKKILCNLIFQNTKCLFRKVVMFYISPVNNYFSVNLLGAQCGSKYLCDWINIPWSVFWLDKMFILFWYAKLEFVYYSNEWCNSVIGFFFLLILLHTEIIILKTLQKIKFWIHDKFDW